MWLFTVGAMSSEGMDRPCSGDHLASVGYPSRNEILLTCIYWDPLSFDDERVATLRDQHLFVIFVHMFGGHRVFRACPKCHLASIFSINRPRWISTVR